MYTIGVSPFLRQNVHIFPGLTTSWLYIDEVDGTGDTRGFGIAKAFVHGGETLKLCIGGLTFICGDWLKRLGEAFEILGEYVGEILLEDLTGVLNSYPLLSTGKSSYMLVLGSKTELLGGVR